MEKLFLPIRRTSTMYRMPICPTSSTFGCGDRWKAVFPVVVLNCGRSKKSKVGRCSPIATATKQCGGFFMSGMTLAMRKLAEDAHPAIPVHDLLRV